MGAPISSKRFAVSRGSMNKQLEQAVKSVALITETA
jgi:hypothetical protein